MIVVEKKSAAGSDLVRRIDDPVDQRARPIGTGRRDVPVDVLDDDRRAVDDDPEIDRTDREQVCRLVLHEEHHDREQQCQRDHDRHDPRAGEISQEDEQDRDDQPHSHEQVVHDVIRRHVNELRALVEDLDSHPRWKQLPFLDFQDLFPSHGVGNRFRLLRISASARCPRPCRFPPSTPSSRPTKPRRG